MPAFPATPVSEMGYSRNIRQYTLAAAQTFKLGAAVVVDGSQNIAECGADPALIRGFAAEPATLDPEGSTKVLVYVVDQGEKFWMAGTSNPVKANIGEDYGLVKDGDGIWVVDITDTTNVRVYVHEVDLTRNLFKVSVIEANRQGAA